MKTPKSLLPDDGEEEEGIIMNAQNVDFSEYEWMGEEEIEEFDRKVFCIVTFMSFKFGRD